MNQPAARPKAAAPKTAEVAAPAPPKRASTALDPAKKLVGGVIPIETVQDAMDWAAVLIREGMAPSSLDTPGKVLVALEYGNELGLGRMESLQSIAVVNGRPSIWGQAVPRLLYSSGFVDSLEMGFAGEGDAAHAWVDIRRKGSPTTHRVTFSVADAKQAGLWGGERCKSDAAKADSPWVKYPKDMLRWKALARAAKLYAPDALAGLQVAEDVIDITPDSVKGSPELDVPHADPILAQIGVTEAEVVEVEPITEAEIRAGQPAAPEESFPAPANGDLFDQ